MGKNHKSVRIHKLTDKDSLVVKVKSVCTSKAKQGIYSLLPVGKQMFGHFQGKLGPSCSVLERQTPPLLTYSHSSFLARAFITEHDVTVCNLFGQPGSAVLPLILPRLFPGRAV